jgi:lipid-binding SYLF domain-containing protein
VVVEEGKEVNEKFYGEEGVVAKEILGGRVNSSGWELDELVQVLRVITW